MVGNISLYDVTGNRQHTVLYRCSPGMPEKQFFSALGKNCATVKKHYPDALYLGIADGAKIMSRFYSNKPVVNYWTFFTSLNIWQTSLMPPIQEKRTNHLSG